MPYSYPEKHREERRAYFKKWRLKHKKEDNARSKKYGQEHRQQCNARSNKWNQIHKDKRRNRQLVRDYNITLEQYNAMLANQLGVCALCHKPFGDKTPSVDHCHKTGKVRGLLHQRCNNGIGCFDDSPELTIAATEYLVKHSEDSI